MTPRVVAHRGLTRLYPENTQASVRGALRAGLRLVEIDVQLSADGVPVVYHDAALKRVSGRSGDIRKLSWKQLQRVSAHEPGRFGQRYATERISSLKALCALVARTPSATLFVELKEESLLRFGRVQMLDAVLNALGRAQRQCVLISFDREVLELARTVIRLPVGPVLRRLSELRQARFKALKPEWVFCSERLLPQRGSLRALAGKAKLVVYEVPDPAPARALLKRGAHAVETFKADILEQELALWHA